MVKLRVVPGRIFTLREYGAWFAGPEVFPKPYWPLARITDLQGVYRQWWTVHCALCMWRLTTLATLLAAFTLNAS